MKSPIETIYRVRIDYDIEVDCDIEESIESRVLSFKANGLSVVCWHGGPCWSPYIIIEGDKLSEVERFGSRVERYIDSRKDAKVS